MVTKNSTAKDPTLYTFYSSNLTLYVENFSVPYPQDVRGVKFICDFNVIIQRELITAETITAVIPGFCKFITRYKSWMIQPYLLNNYLAVAQILINLFFTTDPPKITASLDNITVIPQGSSHTFMVQVYSHPPSRVHCWQLNGREISAAKDPHFVLDGPLISGNTSNFSLTIQNARFVHCACINFVSVSAPKLAYYRSQY